VAQDWLEDGKGKLEGGADKLEEFVFTLANNAEKLSHHPKKMVEDILEELADSLRRALEKSTSSELPPREMGPEGETQDEGLENPAEAQSPEGMGSAMNGSPERKGTEEK
jgi:hypothetical protein